MNILDFLFPQKCIECKTFGDLVCIKCQLLLKKPQQRCIVCLKYSKNGITHPNCKNKTNIQKTTIIYSYNTIVKKIVKKAKYDLKYEYTNELAKLALPNIKANFPKKTRTLIVPVPLHKSKQKKRGFNQSQQMAALIAKNLNWDIKKDVVIKTKLTKNQAKLSKNERETNLAGAFQLKNATGLKNYKKIVIFDDIITTGSTVKEISNLFTGKSKIEALSIAG